MTIEEYKFHQNKSPISINDQLLTKQQYLVSFGKQDFKYFIGYKDSEKIRPLCILRPQMIIYIKKF